MNIHDVYGRMAVALQTRLVSQIFAVRTRDVKPSVSVGPLT